MDPSRNSEAIEPEVERIKDEGKQWAGNVTDDNAWDSLLLTLGRLKHHHPFPRMSADTSRRWWWYQRLLESVDPVGADEAHSTLGEENQYHGYRFE